MNLLAPYINKLWYCFEMKNEIRGYYWNLLKWNYICINFCRDLFISFDRKWSTVHTKKRKLLFRDRHIINSGRDRLSLSSSSLSLASSASSVLLELVEWRHWKRCTQFTLLIIQDLFLYITLAYTHTYTRTHNTNSVWAEKFNERKEKKNNDGIKFMRLKCKNK